MDSMFWHPPKLWFLFCSAQSTIRERTSSISSSQPDSFPIQYLLRSFLEYMMISILCSTTESLRERPPQRKVFTNLCFNIPEYKRSTHAASVLKVPVLSGNVLQPNCIELRSAFPHSHWCWHLWEANPGR